jgi:hypothetical protein
VGALLANQNKFLIMSCIKGFKEHGYSRIVDWYLLLHKNIGYLSHLLHVEVTQVRQTMGVLRCGLFSKDLEVTELTFKLFIKLFKIVNDNPESPPLIQFRHELMGWLT